MVKFFSTERIKCWEVPLAGLLMLLPGISASEAKPVATNDFHTPAASEIVVQTKTSGKNSTISTLKGNLPEKDGIYLYGQSSEPARVGQEYVVFELRQDKVVGAFYLPQSEFSCFAGTLSSGKLNLMIASSPDSDTYPGSVAGKNQQVATTSDKPIVGTGPNPMTYSYSVALQNYHKLASVGTDDQQILRTCKNSRP